MLHMRSSTNKYNNPPFSQTLYQQKCQLLEGRRMYNALHDNWCSEHESQVEFNIKLDFQPAATELSSAIARKSTNGGTEASH